CSSLPSPKLFRGFLFDSRMPTLATVVTWVSAWRRSALVLYQTPDYGLLAESRLLFRNLVNTYPRRLNVTRSALMSTFGISHPAAIHANACAGLPDFWLAHQLTNCRASGGRCAFRISSISLK